MNRHYVKVFLVEDEIIVREGIRDNYWVKTDSNSPEKPVTANWLIR